MVLAWAVQKLFKSARQILEDMPAISDLLGLWSTSSRPFLVRRRAISADHDYAQMLNAAIPLGEQPHDPTKGRLPRAFPSPPISCCTRSLAAGQCYRRPGLLSHSLFSPLLA
jgi:hypothetical protein